MNERIDDSAPAPCSVSVLCGDGYESCPLHSAEVVLWRKNGSWMGPMPLDMCVWPSFAVYVFARKKSNATHEPAREKGSHS